MKRGPLRPADIAVPIRAHARVPAAPPGRQWGGDVQHILCVRLDNLGDVLMTTPALHALKTGHPERQLTLLASGSGAQAARFVDDIDHVIEYDAPWVKHGQAEAKRDLAMRDRLAAQGFDAAVIFNVYSQNPLPAAMLCHLADIPRRLAHCRENPYRLLTDWVAECEPQHGTRHEVERQLALVAHVGAVTNDTHMRFAVRETDEATLGYKLAERGIDLHAPFLAMHPGATAASRRYPPERFAAAAKVLATMTGWPVAVTGSASEAALCAQVWADDARIVDLAGVLELGELAALVRHARVLVSNNSGPVHIASALGTPVVDLYALTNPQHMPWQTPHRVLYRDVPCRWCYRSVCPEKHHRCLLGVRVDDVVAAVRSLLDPQRRTTLSGTGPGMGVPAPPLV
ncbi:MAG TPA: lipopolysaccharide heptosyltransferase II [Trinickia sp.]|jgi:lipopolysaccharide heptosyltransferase II|uniref:lipopolysaccharide heptosyltransferase II n=1 Tax=Trinickia sp. TaxID=2571163 RepID=UPI002CB914E9|nr:lipopolysaccharide heptosyltransferase II [Trinickia sp.]HTI16606.1 lipopolysaccharide heptosyltransferase II [Trinickia sp.]